MPLITALPKELENAEAILKRELAAQGRKRLWHDLYREAYQYTLPQREIFHFHSPGAKKGRDIFDSTALDATQKAANKMQAMLTPPWREWTQLSPGTDVDPEQAEDSNIIEALQEATDTLFGFINHSNFHTAIHESFLDLMVGTATLTLEEGEGENLLDFNTVPLGEVELEAGPNGTVENVYRPLKVQARLIERQYPGAKLSVQTQELVKKKPETEVELIHAAIFDPKGKKYYRILIEKAAKHIAWRWDDGETGPYIVSRATVVSGELYGRGPVINALPDIKTVNKMVEFMLRHSALQIAPPFTAVTDGVVNPYTLRVTPNTVIPVASNAKQNPSLRPVDTGGNFVLGEAMVEKLRESIKRMLFNDIRRPEGPVRSATEIAIDDRDFLMEVGSVFGRIQAELLTPIIRRAVDILQRAGKIPKIKVDGRQLTLKYTSPLARAQDTDDLLSMQRALETIAPLGQEILLGGFKVEEFPGWVARKTGMDQELVRSETERENLKDQLVDALAQIQSAQVENAA